MTNESKSKVAELLEGVEADATADDEGYQNAYPAYSIQILERVFGPVLADYAACIKELNTQVESLINANINKVMAATNEQIDAAIKLDGHDPEHIERLAKQAATLALRSMEIKELNEHIAALNALLVQQERELKQYRNVPTHPVVMRDREIVNLATQIEALDMLNNRLEQQNTNLSRAVAELTETKADFYRSGVAEGRRQVLSDTTSMSFNIIGTEITPPCASDALMQELADESQRLGLYYVPSVNDELLERLARGDHIDWTDPANFGATAPERAAFRRGYKVAIQCAEAAKKEPGK